MKLYVFKKTVLVISLLHAYQLSYANPITSEANQQLAAITTTAHAKNQHDEIKEDLKQVTGGVNFIELAPQTHMHLSNTADLFQLQAGVYAQNSGNEGAKISIRGSGINRGPGAHASGMYSTLDGIPFTGPGGTPYELLETWWLDHVKVYRGANGFQQGGLSLGGTIDYASKTGLNTQGGELKYELGSRGYHKYQLSHAGQEDQFDYYVAVTGSQYDGIQEHAAGSAKGAMLNFGYQFSPNFENRTYIRFRETAHQTPGRLTQQQIEQDPAPANPYNLSIDAKRVQPGSLWLANQSTWQISDQDQLQFALAYHHYPMDLQESLYRTLVRYDDINAQAIYQSKYTFGNLAHESRLAWRSTINRPNSDVTETLRKPTLIDGQLYDQSTVTRRFHHVGSDHVLQYDHQIQLTDQLRVEAGVGASYNERETEVTYPATDKAISRQDWHMIPRLAFHYNVQPNLSVYGNVSRSVEPAHAWSMIWGSPYYFSAGNGASTGRHRQPVDLKPQTANTFELGTRGEQAWGQWDVSYYYSAVKNELLSVEIQQNPTVIAENNASPTRHQGIELALNTPIMQLDSGKIDLVQAYTWQDFHYKNDEKFANNALAGIPEHFYQAQLTYQMHNGIYAGINTEYASRTPVDYANTSYRDAYHIWGVNLGYAPHSAKWSTWLNFKNIGDKRYAAIVVPGYNDQGLDAARFVPAEGFSTYAGMSFKF